MADFWLNQVDYLKESHFDLLPSTEVQLPAPYFTISNINARSFSYIGLFTALNEMSNISNLFGVCVFSSSQAMSTVAL